MYEALPVNMTVSLRVSLKILTIKKISDVRVKQKTLMRYCKVTYLFYTTYRLKGNFTQKQYLNDTFYTFS